MLLAFFQQGVVLLVAALVLGDPAFGEFAGLNVFERRLHTLFDAGIHDFRPDTDIAPLGSFGNRKAHAADSGFVYQINDELKFMQTFEVRHLWLVAGFDQSFISRGDERADTTAKDGLFSEQI